jgi:hypothetical protein
MPSVIAKHLSEQEVLGTEFVERNEIRILHPIHFYYVSHGFGDNSEFLRFAFICLFNNQQWPSSHNKNYKPRA